MLSGACRSLSEGVVAECCRPTGLGLQHHDAGQPGRLQLAGIHQEHLAAGSCGDRRSTPAWRSASRGMIPTYGLPFHSDTNALLYRAVSDDTYTTVWCWSPAAKRNLCAGGVFPTTLFYFNGCFSDDLG